MREGDVAQLLDRQHACQRLAHQGKQPAGARMKEQRLIVYDEILIKRKAAGAFGDDWRVDAIDLVRHLMHVRSRLRVRDHQ
jgi:hypothetical protein